MDFILLFILFIDCENLNIKIQYAANNPGVKTLKWAFGKMLKMHQCVFA